MSDPELVDDAPFIEITGIHRISRAPLSEAPGGTDPDGALGAFLSSIADVRVALIEGSATSVGEGLDDLDRRAAHVVSLMKGLIGIPAERDPSSERRPR